MSEASLPFTCQLDGEDLKIAIVVSRFNSDICQTLLANCRAELKKLGVLDQNILQIDVPGALEIPYVLSQLCQNTKLDLSVALALGCVIRGETYHFELVCNESARHLSQVSLKSNLPIINGILTTETHSQAQERAQDKALDFARSAVEMGLIKQALGSWASADIIKQNLRDLGKNQ